MLVQIEKCGNSANINVTANLAYIGGIVGSNNTSVIKCYNTGTNVTNLPGIEKDTTLTLEKILEYLEED